MIDLAKQAYDLLGIDLTPRQIEQFATYESRLIEWNAHTNLTAITEPNAIRVRHFLDSLSVVKATAIAPAMRVIDIGAGAGFPGLPLAIVFEQTQVTLLDAVGKKVAFMQHIIETLDLKNAQAIHNRAEDMGQDAAYRAHYDLVLARAVARLPGLLEYMLPLTKVGGYCIALKGISAQEEAASATRALDVLGGTLAQVMSIHLPDVEQPHHLIVVKKVANTPASYPRRSGIPTRKPIA